MLLTELRSKTLHEYDNYTNREWVHGQVIRQQAPGSAPHPSYIRARVSACNRHKTTNTLSTCVSFKLSCVSLWKETQDNLTTQDSFFLCGKKHKAYGGFVAVLQLCRCLIFQHEMFIFMSCRGSDPVAFWTLGFEILVLLYYVFPFFSILYAATPCIRSFVHLLCKNQNTFDKSLLKTLPLWLFSLPFRTFFLSIQIPTNCQCSRLIFNSVDGHGLWNTS